MQECVLPGEPIDLDPYRDFADRRELHRVADQIGDDLTQSGRIASHQVRHARRDLVDELDALLVGARRERVNRVVEQLAHFEFDMIQVELARLDLREVEDVVQEKELTLVLSRERP